MDFFKTVESRHSVRSFKGQEIEGEKLRKILEAARQAPSAGNLQAFKIIIVRSRERKESLSRAAYGQNFVAQAPVNLVFLADPLKSSRRYGRRGEELYCLQDATIACCYAQLACQSVGLSSCWVGAFDNRAVVDALTTPNLFPVALLSVGYSDVPSKSTSRVPFDELVEEEVY